MPRGMKPRNTAESICSVEGCKSHVMDYMRHGVKYYRKFCFAHYAEMKKEWKQKYGASQEDKEDFKFAREWNLKHPIKIECVMGIIAGFKNQSRIPSGGRINKIRIEGE